MIKEIKQKWIEALESGEFKQTTECLEDETGYCCWGVFCKINNYEQGIYSGIKESKNFSTFTDVQAFTDKFKIKSIMFSELALQNDLGRSFKEIAQYIKENIPDE